MGDRLLMQVHDSKTGKFSPVIYCHCSGDRAPEICARLKERMKDRMGDVDYTAARLVQEAIADDESNLAFGIWNANKLLSDKKESHGDAGIILIDVGGEEMTFKAIHGYWENRRSIFNKRMEETVTSKHLKTGDT